jgi:hypothetical protein
MEKNLCEKLWEIEYKLEELKIVFVDSIKGDAEAREYASRLIELERSFNQLVDFIAMKKGLHALPKIPVEDDVEKILHGISQVKNC